mgnify:CR=1 FL=1
MADEIFVINVGGYIGSSTRSEIEYAEAAGKPVRYCSNEGNIYTESLGQQAYTNNPKFKKFIADNGLGFKAYDKFGKTEITERT